jgi:hypothetical protein
MFYFNMWSPTMPSTWQHIGLSHKLKKDDLIIIYKHYMLKIVELKNQVLILWHTQKKGLVLCNEMELENFILNWIGLQFCSEKSYLKVLEIQKISL